MTDPVGHLAEFIDKNRIILGLVQNAKKGRLGILTASDKQLALPQGRVLLFTPAGISPERPRDVQVAYMRQVDQRREELAQQVDVPLLWDLVHEEEESLPLAELAELNFGRPTQDDHLGAVLRALFNERQHFRLAGGEFIPLTQAQLEQKTLQGEKEAAHQAELDSAVAYLKALPPEGAISNPTTPPEGLFGLLRDLLVFEDESPSAKKAKEIASLAEIGGRRQLFDLLVRLGVLSAHENLPLLRERLPVGFTPALIEQAQSLDPAAVLDQGREDLTGLYTFTIDGLYTTDFDDALSFEPQENGGGVLGVHITDAAAMLPAGHPLDLEAKERGTTIYLPDNRVPMLPPQLSEEALSLREGCLRPAISCLATVDGQGRVDSYRLVRSVLKVRRRLTYEEADELLQSDPHLSGLYQACLALRTRRGQEGAYFLPLPEVLIWVNEEAVVSVRRVDREGPSREMVAETAILANQLMARFAAENQIPALYRTQPPPSEPIEEGGPDDLFLHFKQRRLLNPVCITTEPGLHSSLGVQGYTHASSPIRRYLDLVMQRQLGRALAGDEPAYTGRELEEMAMQVQPTVRRAMKVRQARQRYWLLKWLEQRQGESLPALVMEYQLRRWQLLLTDIMMLVTVPSQPGLSLEPGQEVAVKVAKVDSFNDILRVKLA